MCLSTLTAIAKSLHRIARVYETETYDYPVHVQESLVELSSSVAHNVTSFAATNLKGTNLPAPSVMPPPKLQPKTLPHALSRAAVSGASSLGPDLRLSKALQLYGGALDKVSNAMHTAIRRVNCRFQIGNARLEQDEVIVERFLQPWQVTLSSSIAVAMKARAAVRTSRLELDSAKQT